MIARKETHDNAQRPLFVSGNNKSFRVHSYESVAILVGRVLLCLLQLAQIIYIDMCNRDNDESTLEKGRKAYSLFVIRMLLTLE